MNYNNGKIYKLVDYTNNNVYYGSTTQSLSKRLSSHKSKYKSYLNGKYHFITSFIILENNNYDIFLVEKFPCEGKDELHQREGYYISNNICVNKIVVGRTSKQYYIDNKNLINEQKKRYYDANKDKFKQYYNDNKDLITEYKKQYREVNKDMLKEKNKQYYIDNKNKILEKVKCECGLEITRASLSKHTKSKRHSNLIQKAN